MYEWFASIEVGIILSNMYVPELLQKFRQSEPNSSQLTAHSSQLTAHSSQLTAHSSQLTLNLKKKFQEIKSRFVHQKTRLLSEFLDGLHSSAVTSSLRFINSIIYEEKCQIEARSFVEVRGIDPPHSGFVDWMPHQRTPTNLVYQKRKRITTGSSEPKSAVTRKIPRIVTTTLLIFSLILQNLLFNISPVYAASSPWTQTDWSGGSGQTSWSDNTKFDSSSSVTTSTAGQLTLSATSGWCSNASSDSSWKYRKKLLLTTLMPTEHLEHLP